MTFRIRIAHWLRRIAERLDPTPIDMWPVVPQPVEQHLKSVLRSMWPQVPQPAYRALPGYPKLPE